MVLILSSYLTDEKGGAHKDGAPSNNLTEHKCECRSLSPESVLHITVLFHEL